MARSFAIHTSLTRAPDRRAWLAVAVVTSLWLLAYAAIEQLARRLTDGLLRLPLGSQLGEGVAFFLHDVPKILLMMGGMVFLSC